MFNTRETLTSQVRREGMLAGEINMVERFLKAGAPWEMVVNATGITQEKLEELKATLQEIMDRQTQREDSRQFS